MGLKVSNNASTTLSSSIGSGATSLVAVDATRFPTLAGGTDFFWITMVNASNPNVWETIKVVGPFTPGASATMSNLVRGSNADTSSTGAAQSWTAGDKIANRLNKQTLDEFPRLNEVNTFVAGQNIPGFAPTASPTFTGTVTIPALGGGEATTVAVNKGYVDNLIQGMKPKGSVRAATTGNITRSGTQTIDTIALSVSDVVLVKNQTAPAENGIFVVAAGAWTRATNSDTWTELTGAYVFVENNGSTQQGTQWVANLASGGTLDTTAVSFYEFGAPLSFTPGTGISISTAGQISWSATGTTITSAIGSSAVTNATNATNAVTTTNIAGGSGGSVPYQTAAGATSLLANGTNGQVLTSSGGTAAPTWTTISAGGLTTTDDTTTNNTYYPVFVTSIAGSTAKMSSTKFTFNPSSGSMYATEVVTASDSRLKYNSRNIYDGLSIINSMRPISFNWIEGNKKSYGVIAQELEVILPELVDTTENDTKHVNYIAMIGLLIGAVKELSTKVDALEAK
jgi:hypothetical protein